MNDLQQYVTYEGPHHAFVEGEKLLKIGQEENDPRAIEAGELVIKSMTGFFQKTYTFPNGFIATVGHNKNLSDELFKIDLCKKDKNSDMLLCTYDEPIGHLHDLIQLNPAQRDAALQEIFALPKITQ